MLLGQKVKEAIEYSEFSTEDVAAYIGISHTNLYRIYKKDSFEVKYLIKIAEKLNLPLGYFLNDETIGAITQSGSSNQVQQATNVGSNHQQISMGVDDCIKQLEAVKRENTLLEKAVADKDIIIELLRGQASKY